MRLPLKAKDWLKSHPMIYRVNAEWKSYRLGRDLSELRSGYLARARAAGYSYDAARAWSAARVRIGARRAVIRAAGELGIFWVGANQPQDNAGFLQSLREFGEVTCFHNRRGGYGQHWPSGDGPHHYDPAVARENGEDLLEQVERVRKTARVDIVLGQMWANAVECAALQRIQRMGIVTANISMDDRLPHLWESCCGTRMGSIGLSDGLDMVLTSSPECCLWYGVEGHPAVYWPMASSESMFTLADERSIGAAFVGSNYGFRGQLVRAMLDAGLPVEAYGPGWPNGPVGAEEMARIFGRAKIVLGTANLGYNRDLFTLKQRDFDAPMSGALYITQRNLDLETHFREGVEIECYGDIRECVAKVRRYLADPLARESIARAGRARALREHVWQLRFQTLFSGLGLA